MNYKCPECGCEKIYAKPSNRRMGIYCMDCNSFICWTTYLKMREIYKELEESELNDKITVRKIFKKNGVTTMRCLKCGCLLFTSTQPKIVGQFDLVNATYCPVCGRTLI